MFRDSKGGNQKREFQAGLNPAAHRRKREDDRLELRKANRENRLKRKRQALTDRSRQYDDDTTEGTQSTTNHNSVLQDLPRYVQGCYSDQPAAQFECTQHIRHLLSATNSPPIDAVVSSGVVTRLIQFLRLHQMPPLQFEAAWALTNIASGSAEHTAVIIRHGAVPIFVKLMDSPSNEVKEQAVWALGNIAGDSAECRNLVLRHGAHPKLLNLVRLHLSAPQSMPASLIRNVVWTLCNFCRGSPNVDWKILLDIIRGLGMVLQADDTEILQDALWGIQYAADVDGLDQQKHERFSILHSDGALQRIVKLVGHRSWHVQHPAVRAIGSLLTGTDEQTQTMLDLGVLPQLNGILTASQSSPALRRETCWTISNVTGGSAEQIDAVMMANMFPPLINILRNDQAATAKEALWALSNALSGGSDNVILFLVQQGVLWPLLRFLKMGSAPKIMIMSLESMERILECGQRQSEQQHGMNEMLDLVEECGALDALEELQGEETLDEDVYDKIVTMMATYWEGEDTPGVDEVMPQQPEGSGGMFGFGSCSQRGPGNGNDNAFSF